MNREAASTLFKRPLRGKKITTGGHFCNSKIVNSFLTRRNIDFFVELSIFRKVNVLKYCYLISVKLRGPGNVLGYLPYSFTDASGDDMSCLLQ